MNHKKALLKTLSWRAISSTSFFLVVWIYGVDLQASIMLTVADAVFKSALFYGHELAWQGKLKR